MRFWPAATVDAIAIVVFAIVGRRSHDEAASLAGIWHTAWPFLAGAVAGTMLSRAWRAPARLVTGAIVCACTVAGGVALRLATGNTAALAFIVVASITLAILLLGWRAAYALIQRSRTSSAERTAA
jgi:Protein of unknown function (DUF3054)